MLKSENRVNKLRFDRIKLTLRLFQIIVNISRKSNELFELCKEQGYIDFLVSELDTEDILYQLNILELLTHLSESPHCIAHLIKHGSFKTMVQRLQDLQNNPLKALLVTGWCII